MRLLQAITESKYYRELAENVKKAGLPAAVFGAMPFVGALFAAAYAENEGEPAIAVFATDGDASRAADDLLRLGISAAPYVARDFVLLDVESASHETEQARLLTLGRLLRGEIKVVCASAAALMQPTVPAAVLKERSFTVKAGEKLSPSELAGRLVMCGYVRCPEVESSGQFAVRGGIVDIFPCCADSPVRLDYFGDVPDEIFEFDIMSQRRTLPLKSIDITPAREVVPGGEQAEKLEKLLAGKLPEKLRDIVKRDAELLRTGALIPAPDRYLPFLCGERVTLAGFAPYPLFLCGSADVFEREKREIAESEENLRSLVESGFITKEMYSYFCPRPTELLGRGAALFEAFTRDVGSRLSAVINLQGCSELRWNGDVKQLREDIADFKAQGLRIAVLAGTRRAAAALRGDIESDGCAAVLTSEAEFDVKAVSVCALSVSRGFSIPSLGLCLISSQRQEAAGRRSRTYKRQGRGIGSLSDLNPGDYVVHINHGVGVYKGINTIDFHGTVKDYIAISYRGGDMLYVPVTQLDMVSLYTSPSEQKAPPIAKLNSGEWQKTRQTVYKSARDMAKELINLYAKREHEEGVAFEQDSEWQRDFEARFQYDETDDQLRSISEIKEDMEKSRPMDRLLCGDVGVGKTEVAMRAAFKCVDEGYQCALLVPTTILAWQHFNTFSERFEEFPVNISMLSRFSTPKQIREGIKGINDGTVDIAIGTHKLLQKDIRFKRLGLLIVDEEQRFGVAHKEKLKQSFPGVDVLTLSATPIPRTLNMAMSGIRDMSVIEQPPFGRQPVQTYVMEYDESVIADAIRRELARAGQVYYLHNRVESIEQCAEKLRRIAPDARIEVAHGRMDEAALSRVWGRIINNECDIVVCTTIIETGVDVPNCNTLIVENADCMGLSQLYQLRGRVGRSSRRAYAYFTFRRDSVLGEVASKRLTAIRDFTGFGSGYRIAMRDLQIRGAGSVLNASQSGHMQAVGYDMYLKILSDAINDEKGVSAAETRDCVVDIAVDAHLPEKYISDPSARIEIYKRIAAADSEEAADDVCLEMRDRFGELPQSAKDLVAVSLIRTSAARLGFYEVKSRDDSVFLYSDSIDVGLIKEYVRRRLPQIGICLKGKAYILIAAAGSPAQTVRELLSRLELIAQQLKKVDNNEKV